ncbi:MAG: hypothetical protein B5M51_00050 [Anaerolinea sp. 4484_236]|nr:MAG: hypothetical protein B5M51_00050 [Anaerolinea sp. 4484_236]
MKRAQKINKAMLFDAILKREAPSESALRRPLQYPPKQKRPLDTERMFGYYFIAQMSDISFRRNKLW